MSSRHAAFDHLLNACAKPSAQAPGVGGTAASTATGAPNFGSFKIQRAPSDPIDNGSLALPARSDRKKCASAQSPAATASVESDDSTIDYEFDESVAEGAAACAQAIRDRIIRNTAGGDGVDSSLQDRTCVLPRQVSSAASAAAGAARAARPSSPPKQTPQRALGLLPGAFLLADDDDDDDSTPHLRPARRPSFQRGSDAPPASAAAAAAVMIASLPTRQQDSSPLQASLRASPPAYLRGGAAVATGRASAGGVTDDDEEALLLLGARGASSGGHAHKARSGHAAAIPPPYTTPLRSASATATAPGAGHHAAAAGPEWACSRCTFDNPAHVVECSMCATVRSPMLARGQQQQQKQQQQQVLMSAPTLALRSVAHQQHSHRTDNTSADNDSGRHAPRPFPTGAARWRDRKSRAAMQHLLDDCFVARLAAHEPMRRDFAPFMSRKFERRVDELAVQATSSSAQQQQRTMPVRRDFDAAGRQHQRHAPAAASAAPSSKQLAEIRPLQLTDEPLAVCASLGIELRGYQREGVNFLLRNFSRGMGSLLADDMGLGKTAQSCVFLAALRDRVGLAGPHLILCPLSTLSAWMRELQRWAPSLHVVCYRGSQPHRQRLQLPGARVFVTTPNTFCADRAFFLGRTFGCVIIDEAHSLRNDSSQINRFTSRLRACGRVGLTGTPVANAAAELWSIMCFLYPEMSKGLARPDSDDAEAAGEAAALLRHVMLRRTKHEILRDLPDKFVHVTLPLEPSHVQQIVLNALFDTVSDSAAGRGLQHVIWSCHKINNHPLLFGVLAAKKGHSVVATSSSSSSSSGAGGGGWLSVAELVARKSAAVRLIRSRGFPMTPGLEMLVSSGAELSDREVVVSSAKMMQLDALLAHIRTQDPNPPLPVRTHTAQQQQQQQQSHHQQQPPQRGDASAATAATAAPRHVTNRVLIFSKFATQLDILEGFCVLRDYPYERLDGDTLVAERELAMARFNHPTSRVFLFLITTTAGGVGVTLTGANHVVFYDTSFNPATDRQAADRAHRIGQTRVVHVHRLCVAGSIEWNVLQVAARKARMGDFVIDGKAMVDDAVGDANGGGKSAGISRGRGGGEVVDVDGAVRGDDASATDSDARNDDDESSTGGDDDSDATASASTDDSVDVDAESDSTDEDRNKKRKIKNQQQAREASATKAALGRQQQAAKNEKKKQRGLDSVKGSKWRATFAAEVAAAAAHSGGAQDDAAAVATFMKGLNVAAVKRMMAEALSGGGEAARTQVLPRPATVSSSSSSAAALAMASAKAAVWNAPGGALSSPSQVTQPLVASSSATTTSTSPTHRRLGEHQACSPARRDRTGQTPAPPSPAIGDGGGAATTRQHHHLVQVAAADDDAAEQRLARRVIEILSRDSAADGADGGDDSYIAPVVAARLFADAGAEDVGSEDAAFGSRGGGDAAAAAHAVASTCFSCKETGHSTRFLHCRTCNKAYHMRDTCLHGRTPPTRAGISMSNWVCLRHTCCECEASAGATAVTFCCTRCPMADEGLARVVRSMYFLCCPECEHRERVEAGLSEDDDDDDDDEDEGAEEVSDG